MTGNCGFPDPVIVAGMSTAFGAACTAKTIPGARPNGRRPGEIDLAAKAHFLLSHNDMGLVFIRPRPVNRWIRPKRGFSRNLKKITGS